MGFIEFFKKLFAKNDTLIEELVSEHKELFEIYKKIDTAAGKKQFNKIPKLLKDFEFNYRKHILLEDNFLYSKLLNKYANDEEKVKFINVKKEEMNHITAAIENFMQKYKSEEDIRQNEAHFKNALENLGNALVKRVKFEEKELYPLY
jgi:regulator of sigma D